MKWIIGSGGSGWSGNVCGQLERWEEALSRPLSGFGWFVWVVSPPHPCPCLAPSLTFISWLWVLLGLDRRHGRAHQSSLLFQSILPCDAHDHRQCREKMMQRSLGCSFFFLENYDREKYRHTNWLTTTYKKTWMEHSVPSHGGDFQTLPEDTTSWSCHPNPYQNLGMINDNVQTSRRTLDTYVFPYII